METLSPGGTRAVVVGVAGREVEAAIHADRFHRTGGDAKLAVEAGGVVERHRDFVEGAVDDDGAEQDEAAEARMDDVAVKPHAPEPGRLRNRFMRDHPHAGRIGLRFHREGGRRIDRADAHILETAHGAARDMVHLVIGLVELFVHDRADGGSHRVAVHADDETDKRLRAGKQRADPHLLVGDRRV